MSLFEDILNMIRSGLNNHSESVEKYEERYRRKYFYHSIDEIEKELVKIIRTKSFAERCAAYNIFREKCDSESDFENRLSRYRISKTD